MGYKDKYNKLVEAIKVLQETNPSDEGLQNWVNDNVPELKESEAERIRKWCISHFNGCISVIKENDEYKKFLSNKVIAWLEKQGEKEAGEWKEGNVIRHGGILALAIEERKAMKSNGEIFTIQHPDEWVKAKSNEIKRFFNGFAKQCELPRYSIGDVLCDLSCNEYDKNAQLKYEIIDIKNGMYICDNGSIPVSQQDEYKLVDKKAEQKPIKANNDEDSVSNELREASFIFAARQMVHKASPEERKLELIYSFEEGAKWDAAQKPTWSEKHIADVFEKVGLAKIVREQSNDALTIALQDAMIELSKVALQPKPTAWSEDDEVWFDEIIDFFENGTVKLQHDLSLYASWLKSLKDRVKTQQEWTMQDEEELQIALDTLVKAGQHSSAKWLKNVCLVPQNKWKPSGVQMTVLDDVITNGHLSNANERILRGLQDQLKKLK